MTLSLNEESGKKLGKVVGKAEVPIGLLISCKDETVSLQVFDDKSTCSAIIKMNTAYETEKIAIKAPVITEVKAEP